jgi:glycosyltransferase involved in cell wall biosynthesis
VVIQALRIVVKKFPELRFKILGAGGSYPWVALAKKNNVSKHIEFCGTLAHGQPVFEWLDTIDLYLQPSFQEGLPRALIEAMSRACPALGSTAGGIPELLPLDCLHQPGDYRKLSDGILRACQNKDWCVQQAKRNVILAKSYRKESLDLKRAQFWRDFSEFVVANN